MMKEFPNIFPPDKSIQESLTQYEPLEMDTKLEQIVPQVERISQAERLPIEVEPISVGGGNNRVQKRNYYNVYMINKNMYMSIKNLLQK